MNNHELIQRALSVIHPLGDGGEFSAGTVSAALETASGKVYVGVCVDTGSGMGYCAEANAIGSMLSDGETEIMQVVAVWRDDSGKSFVVAPCGRCRQFITAVSKKNLDTKALVGPAQAVPIRDLLPFHDSYVSVD
jgi:cytidine deaminase